MRSKREPVVRRRRAVNRETVDAEQTEQTDGLDTHVVGRHGTATERYVLLRTADRSLAKAYGDFEDRPPNPERPDSPP